MVLRFFLTKKGSRSAQAAAEYFIIFTFIAALTLLSASWFFPEVKNILTDFYKKTALAITGPGAIVPPVATSAIIEVQHDTPGGGNAYSGELTIPRYGYCSATVSSLNCWNKYTGKRIVTNTAKWCARWGICSGVGASGIYPSRWRIKGASGWNDFQLDIIN